MKKIIILLLFMLVMPFVYAEMDIPHVREYEVYVDKEEGIDYYAISGNSLVVDGHLDKGNTLIVSFEYNENGIDYLYFKKDMELAGYVKPTDVIVKEKTVTTRSKGVIRNSTKVKYRVYADSVVVRKGPSIIYEEVGNLEKGTEGYYEYIPETEHGSGYIYIEQNDLKGWINILDGAVLLEGKDYYFVKDYELPCGTIPANTIMNSVWVTDNWLGKILLSYGTCEELVSLDSNVPFVLVDYDVPSYLKFNTEMSIYEYPTNQRNAKKKIPKGKEVAMFAKYPNYPSENELFYVEYDGIRGWTSRVTSSDYVVVDGTEDSTLEPKEEKKYIKEEKKDKEEVVPEEEKKEDKKDEKESNGLDTKTIILICIIAGLTIALTAAITIILVNKKKVA